MKMLCLDLATNCGFAHSDAAKYPAASGTWFFEPTHRLTRLYLKLDEFWKVHWFNLLVLEGAVVPRIGGPGFQALLEMRGVVKLWAGLHNIPVNEGVSPSALKRFATGDGRAKKPAMVAAAKRMFPEISVISDDHADALMLLLYARRELA